MQIFVKQSMPLLLGHFTAPEQHGCMLPPQTPPPLLLLLLPPLLLLLDCPQAPLHEVHLANVQHQL
jgi:hypothetical protein